MASGADGSAVQTHLDVSAIPHSRLLHLLRWRVSADPVHGPEVAALLGLGTSDEQRLTRDALHVLNVGRWYEDLQGPLVPFRSPLMVDLRRRRLAAAGHEAHLWLRRTPYVARRYVALISTIRRLPPGTRFALRIDDLLELSKGLNLPVGIVQSCLARELAPGRIDLGSRVKRGALVPVAGVSLGAISAVSIHQISTAVGTRAGTTHAVVDVMGIHAAASPSPAEPLVVPGWSRNGLDTSALDAPTATRATGGGTGGDGQSGILDPLPSDALLVGSDPNGVAAVGGDTPPPPTPPRTQQALSLIAYDWRGQLPDWQIDFLPERDGLLGYAFFTEQRIEIYVRDAQTPYDIATVIAHELGHAIDVTFFDDAARGRWLEARGIAQHPWWPGEEGSDFASGAGDWAESFAYWLLQDNSQSKLAGPPDAAQQALIAELVSR